MDFFAESAVINTNHRGDVMTHSIHGVMRLMAMKCPVAHFISKEFNLTHLSNRNISRDLRPAAAWWGWTAICTRDRELMSVNMNWVIGHRQIAHPDPHFVVFTNNQRINAREGPTVPGPQIKIQHGHYFGRIATRFNVIRIQQKHEVSVDFRDVRVRSEEH